MRIDVHSHLAFRDFIDYLQGRSTIPNAVVEDGVYVVTCSTYFRQPSPRQHFDMEAKLRDMEEMGVDVSVISHGIPGPEMLGGQEADDWASRINDQLARVAERYPGKFMCWGSIGFGSPERSIAEVDRCINQLGFKGVQLFSNNYQRVVDSPEYMPVYEEIARLGVPMNMHPTAPLNSAGMDHMPLVPGMGFIYDTSLATVRLILSGLFDRHPDLKLIVPHVGGILPYLRGRIESGVDRWVSTASQGTLAHPMAHYVDRIYVDTVAHSLEALEYCYRLMGPRWLLYGTDHPFGNFIGKAGLVEQLDCTEADRELIYHGNAERLLGLQ